jgi:hypothetical protein
MYNKRYEAIETILATFPGSYVDIERYELAGKFVYSASVYGNSEASKADLVSNYDDSIAETMKLLNEKCMDWLEAQEDG